MRATRIALLFCCVIAVIGCQVPPHAADSSARSSPERVDSLNPVPMSVLRDIPDRLPALRTGAAPTEIFAALDLNQYRKQLSAESGGPIDAHWSLYQLRQGFNLLLVFEHRSVGHPRFKDARLSGNGWDSIKKAQKSNNQMQNIDTAARNEHWSQRI